MKRLPFSGEIIIHRAVESFSLPLKVSFLPEFTTQEMKECLRQSLSVVEGLEVLPPTDLVEGAQNFPE